VGTFAVLRALAAITEVSVFSLNLTTGMGLGLAIDYSLFVVSRYREELATGAGPADAVVRTVTTAGRTVLLSALTVAVSLAALLVFPLAFLRSFAYAGIAVVLLAAAGAVVVLPALLAVLGRRVDAWALPRRPVRPATHGRWHRLAVFVMRRPVPVMAAALGLLVLLGSPVLHMRLSLPDERVLPSSAPARRVHEDIRENFPTREISALSVVAPGADPRRIPEIGRYAAALSAVEGVARVDGPAGSFAGGDRLLPPGPLSSRFATAAGVWLSVVPAVEPMSAAGEALVRAVPAVPAPFPVLVGGPSAELVDQKGSMFSRLPWALGLVAAATFVLLFLSFGSVVVPAKALVLNVLSLSATFGAAVWVFQEGHLAGVLGFTPTGALELEMPVLMFCIAFGLSMDYEVFLLSRIKEEHDRTGDNVASVARGLERTGRIVTAAAALLATVFVVFATSEIVFIKLFGLGLATAVVMDATVVRATLVPAFMRLAGEANWWAPRPLRRLHRRFAIHHGDASAAPPLSAPARHGDRRTPVP
jgi:RND superfamily putative drug exporter